MEQLIVNLLQNAINFLNNVFGDMRTHLGTAPSAFAGGAAWSAVTAVNTAIQGTGYGLLICFFFMSFFKSTVNFKDLSMQQVIGLLVRFVLVKAIIDYGMQLLTFAISISMGVNDAIFTSAGGFQIAELPQEVLDTVANIKDAAWYEQIGAFFQTIPMLGLGAIGTLVIWIAGVVLIVSVYLRFFRVYILTAIAPLPLSTFGSPETSQTGKHFLKAYAAVCLEICVIALAIVVFNAMMSSNSLIFPSWGDNNTSVNAEFWDALINYIFQIVLQTVMLAIMVMSANKFIRDALGA